MALRTLAQERARHAWEQVGKAWQKAGADFEQQVADPARKIPMRIRNAGLGQTVAYLRAKDEAPEVVRALSAWCHSRGLITRNDPEEFLIQFKDGPAAKLRLLTAEVLAYLEWYVRFAQARLLESRDAARPR